MRNWKTNFGLVLGGGFSIDLDWIPSDTEEKFIEHKASMGDSKHIQNYDKLPINYGLNNYGFRTPDNFFNEDEGTVYLGCSHTFGTGHYLENVWSYKLHQKIGEGKFFNLSCGSSGIASQYNLLKYFSDKLKIKKVYHFYPDECFFRYEFINKDKKIKVFNLEDFPEEAQPFFIEYMFNDSYNSLHNLSYIDAIKNVCKEMGADYHIHTKSYRNLPIDAYSEDRIPARDLEHYYVDEHDEIVSEFIKLSNQKRII